MRFAELETPGAFASWLEVGQESAPLELSDGAGWVAVERQGEALWRVETRLRGVFDRERPVCFLRSYCDESAAVRALLAIGPWRDLSESA